jgi:L-fuconolactonase
MTSAPPVSVTGHLSPRNDWLARHQEEILEPSLPIVDPHHHLVDRPDTGCYLLPELLADTDSGHNIVATVYLEWLSMYRATGPAEMKPVGEIEFANGIAAVAASEAYGRTRVCDGIVGFADLALGSVVENTLQAQITAGGGPGGRFKGIRYISAVDSAQSAWGAAIPRPDGMLADPRVREGFAKLATLNLTFDAWCYHAQIAELTALARAFPQVPIVLDHVGGPIGLGPYAGKRDEVFATWSKSIAELADCPNTHIKLGGLGMRVFGFDVHEKAEPPDSATLAALWRPYIETCIEAFGAERSMFESNFPVDKGSGSYQVFWNAFKRIAAGCSPSEKAALFAGTATRFYGLDLVAESV